MRPSLARPTASLRPGPPISEVRRMLARLRRFHSSPQANERKRFSRLPRPPR